MNSKENRIVIFGAGKQGESVYRLLKYIHLSGYVDGFCDNNEEKSGSVIIDGIKCYGLAHYLEDECSFVIAVSDPDSVLDIKAQLKRKGKRYYECIRDWVIDGHMEMPEYERMFCAYYHIDQMENYYEYAEKDELLNQFWDENTCFYRCFNQLDLSNVVELGCGRGNHVSKYMDRAKRIVLVDVLEKNIDYCKERFSNEEKIVYYKNNGRDLSELDNSSCTSIFSYNSMVCFEMFDVFEYLKETNRILVPGGLGLFHHSNNHSSYMISFETELNNRKRSYMSKDLFAYLVYRAGLEIVEQHIIDWFDKPELDCLTLVCKKQNR